MTAMTRLTIASRRAASPQALKGSYPLPDSRFALRCP